MASCPCWPLVATGAWQIVVGRVRPHENIWPRTTCAPGAGCGASSTRSTRRAADLRFRSARAAVRRLASQFCCAASHSSSAGCLAETGGSPAATARSICSSVGRFGIAVLRLVRAGTGAVDARLVRRSHLLRKASVPRLLARWRHHREGSKSRTICYSGGRRSHGRIAQEAQTAGGHAEPPWLASGERASC